MSPQKPTVLPRRFWLQAVIFGAAGAAFGTPHPTRTTLRARIPILALPLVIAAAVGVLAAIGPARRASRVDVLQAITAE